MKNQGELWDGAMCGAAAEAPPISLFRNFISLRLQTQLLAEADGYGFSRPSVRVYGKWHPIPREQIWFADEGCDYRYSSLLIPACAWPDHVAKLRQKLNRQFSVNFNGCLVNRYRDGNDSMGFHADNEPELVQDALIAIVSLGQSRQLVLRRKVDGHKCRLTLNGGDLLLMHPPMQTLWEHGIMRTKRLCGVRISYTFRQVIPYFHSSATA